MSKLLETVLRLPASSISVRRFLVSKAVLLTLSSIIFCSALPAESFGVTSSIIRHKNSADMSGGKTDNVVLSPRGTIQLSRDAEVLSQEFQGAWVINTLVVADDGAVYVGTSPNGDIFKYKNGKTRRIYPCLGEGADEFAADANGLDIEHIANKHIFKMATDAEGRLLAAVSGEVCELLCYDGKDFEVIYEPNKAEASYIFSIALDGNGDIYLGTGPHGMIYKLDRKSHKAELVYDSEDKNIMSLAVRDGFIFAGSDTRGLIYKIDSRTKAVGVLYDSEQNEISDIAFDRQGNLYAAATSYKSIKAQMKTDGIPKPAMPGKPELLPTPLPLPGGGNKGRVLKIANSKNDESAARQSPLASMDRKTPPGEASYVYKIDGQGFVTEVFSEAAVFFTLGIDNGNILLGTGNKAQLYRIDADTETETLAYEDPNASQITGISIIGDEAYLCTANPPKLIRMSSSFAKAGEFVSPLIDASQPARWGKLQIDATIPEKTGVMLSARSGNVKDANDETFSDWTKPVRIEGPAELDIPLGRFCQYKLIFSGDSADTPIVREVAAAYMIPNLRPKVTKVEAGAIDKKENKGLINISFAAEDKNNDALTYKIDFRKVGREGWIELEDELTETGFVWDGRTVEDGIYEIRVTASDVGANTEQTGLAGTRISEPVIVDNTSPEIRKIKRDVSGSSFTIELEAVDALSVIGNVSYTLDSNENWKSTLPKDSIYDTMDEVFTITLSELSPGEHVLAVKISDVEANVRYKTFDFKIKD